MGREKNYLRKEKKHGGLKPGNDGFTLVELLCVIALLGLLLLIALPAMADVSSNRSLEIAARTMATELRKTQQKAITCGWSQYVEFRKDVIGNDIYRLKDGKSSEYIELSLPEGISIQANNFPYLCSVKTLKFSRSGAPVPGGTVTLQNCSGKLLYVIVTPATGRVRISELPPENWK